MSACFYEQLMVCVKRMTTSSCLDSSSNITTGDKLKTIVQLFQNNTRNDGDGDDLNRNIEEEEEGFSKMVIRECRICQEEDGEHELESPCSCNGTLKVYFYFFFLFLFLV